MDDVTFLRLENRMRGIVKDLLEPTSRRANEANEAISRLTHKVELLTVRVEDTEVVQLKTLSKLGVLDEYNKRLMEFNANLSIIESKMQKDKQEFLTNFYSLSSTLTSVQEEVSVFERERQSIREDITGLSHNIMETKYDLEQKVAAFKDDYHERLNGAEDRILRAELDTDTVGKKLKKLTTTLEDANNQVEIHSRYIEEIKSDIKKVENKIDFIRNESTTNFELTRSNSIKVNSEMMKIEKNLDTLKNLLKDLKDQGAKNFLRITEPLYKVFSDIPTLKIVAGYDLQRLDERLNEKVEKIVERMKENAENIMKTELPAPKPVEHKKKKKKPKIVSPRKARGSINDDGMGEKLIKHNRIDKTIESAEGVNEHKTSVFTYEDEQMQGTSYIRTIPKHLQKPPVSEGLSGISSINPVLSLNKKKTLEAQKIEKSEKSEKNEKKYPKRRKKTESSESSESSEEAESGSSSSSLSQIIIPEQVDYSPMILKLKSELQEEFNTKIQEIHEKHSIQFKELSDSLSKQDSEIRDQMKKTLDSVDISIKSNEKKIHDIEIIAQQVMYECTSQLNNRKRENNDFNYELKQIKDKISALSKQISVILESIETLTNRFSQLVEYNIVNNTLQSQDESDRESIALMGYKEVKPGKMVKMPKTVINIDKQCFSCTGQSSVVLNAFKIACLAYVPSPVAFQGEQFSRKELIEYQGKMLEGIKSGKNEGLLERRQRAASTTMKNYRPISVPTQQGSPRSEYIDIELPKRLRKSINL